MTATQTDEDDYIDWWMEQQPELTPEEHADRLKRDAECADLILKLGIAPNLDSPY